MGDLEVIGRAVDFESTRPSRPDVKKKESLTLAEASRLTGLSVHELKVAIQEKRLIAEWRGRYEIKREELITFMKASNMPYRLIFELEKA